jgi:hypothetical protein
MKTYVYVIWQFFLGVRNVSVESCREGENTRFMFNNFFPENRDDDDDVKIWYS